MGRIQTARPDGLLRRLFSIKGGGSLMPETLGDLFPVLEIENLPIELRRLSAWEMGAGGISRTAGVGETVGTQLLNPAGSGKIIVPTTVWYTLSAASLVFFGYTAVALATAVVGRQRDTREGVTARTAGILRSGVDPAAPVGAALFRTIANTTIQFHDPDGLAVLAPGTSLLIVPTGTNLRADTGWFWRERTAEPSELAF